MITWSLFSVFKLIKVGAIHQVFMWILLFSASVKSFGFLDENTG